MIPSVNITEMANNRWSDVLSDGLRCLDCQIDLATRSRDGSLSIRPVVSQESLNRHATILSRTYPVVCGRLVGR